VLESHALYLIDHLRLLMRALLSHLLELLFLLSHLLSERFLLVL
jgi:hypothetical protein